MSLLRRARSISLIAIVLVAPAGATAAPWWCYFPVSSQSSCTYSDYLNGSSGWRSYRWQSVVRVSNFGDNGQTFQLWRKNSANTVFKSGNNTLPPGSPPGYYLQSTTAYYLANLLYTQYGGGWYISSTSDQTL